MSNPFKADSGHWYIRQIFYENDLPTKDLVVYTLNQSDREVDGKIYPSLYRLYMEMEDVSEYDFANKYLGGWTHWKRMSESSWFQGYLLDWREELQVKLMAKALNKIRTVANSDTREAFNANKYLITNGYTKDTVASRRGRPSKDSVLKEANKLFKEKDEFKEDFNRLVVNMEDYRIAN